MSDGAVRMLFRSFRTARALGVGSSLRRLRRRPALRSRLSDSRQWRQSAASEETGVGGSSAAAGGPLHLQRALVNVGTAAEWIPFKHPALLEMDSYDLLKAMVADAVFKHTLEGVDLSACSCAVFKLPDGAETPTAADEAPDKMAKLTGLKTMGEIARSIASGEQLCVRVRLPAAAGEYSFQLVPNR